MSPTSVADFASTSDVLTLVIQHDPEAASILAHILEVAGHRVVRASDGGGALRLAAAVRPNLVVLDSELPDMSAPAACRSLRADVATASSGIIITGRNSLAEIEASFDAGADDHILKPYRPRELLARAQSVLRRAKQLRGLSPLTGLPGNFVILNEISHRLAAAVPFALIYADLDNFKAYNDRYGFLQGDDAILLTAKCLEAALHDIDGEPRFLGHVGGDDFVLLVGTDSAALVAMEIATRFEAAAPLMYDNLDIKRGHLITATRTMTTCASPLMTISMGIATTLLRDTRSAHELVAVATEMKALAKSASGSCWRVDRRTAGGSQAGAGAN